MTGDFLLMDNGSAVSAAAIPRRSIAEFSENLILAVEHDNGRLSSLFGVLPNEGADGEALRLYAVVSFPELHKIGVLSTEVAGGSYASIGARLPAAVPFEREIAEQFGVVPVGHPYLKPLRFQRSFTGRDVWGRAADADFTPRLDNGFKMEGDSIHEVAVGPVHAGVIEPGHFRFQCCGETVYFLEIALGYQHRGVERRLIGGPDKLSGHYIETAAGDSTAAHATAYALAVEALSGATAPKSARLVRIAALELERIANHVGDLGALAGDVAYLPTSSFCGRLRGEYLNLTAALCGNRFGRGLIVPGGISARCGVDRRLAGRIVAGLDAVRSNTMDALNLLFDTPSALDRFENTGVVAKSDAVALGMVGVAARASGVARDVRLDFPSELQSSLRPSPALAASGDVMARALVRFHEIAASGKLVRAALENWTDNADMRVAEKLTSDADRFAVSLVEGWRGEVCHAVLTGADGKFVRYKIVDPSFHNWQGLAMALRSAQISDFPICNKSFNLSYCGHDL